MNQLSSEIKSKMNGVPKELQDTAASFGERAGTVAAQAVDQVQDYYQSGRKYVTSNPEKSVAVAALIGFLLGGLFVMGARRK